MSNEPGATGTDDGGNDSGRAVSRILSARPLRQGRGENHLSERPVPETRLAPWSGPLRGLLFGLAPDGVFPASAITREAVGSYPAFSPLPPTHSFQRRYVFCGTIRRKAFRLSSRVYLNRHRLELRGIAPCGVRTFLPGLAPGAILRPSGIAYSLPEWQSIARGPDSKSAGGRSDSRVSANAVAAEVTRRNGCDGKIRLVTSAATTPSIGPAPAASRI